MSEKLNSYYYGFESTGVSHIDSILEAICIAGGAYHHTSDWNEKDNGESCIDMIQKEADKAAQVIRELNQQINNRGKQ